jgi:hypothetical protein
LVHQLSVDILPDVTAAATTICHQAVHLFTNRRVRLRQRVFGALSEYAYRSLGTHRQAVLTLPTPTPAKPFEILNLRYAVNEFQHLTGTYIHTLTASGAAICIDVEFSFVLLHDFLVFS